MTKLVLPLAIALFLLASCAGSLPHPGEQQTVLAPKAAGYPYWLFVPNAAKTQRKAMPLLIFLHGSGERGSDMDKVKVHGPPKRVLTRQDFPFVTVSPLLEADGDWDVVKLDAMLAQVQHKIHIDPQRIYLTGLSRGGHATWRWAAKHPGRFAAIVPISGKGNPAHACALKNTPIWAFHGALDTVVPVTGSSEMVTAVTACGGKAKASLYPDAGHDAWTRTYEDPALYEWLLQQRLPTAQK
jgi:predicted peptidase